MFAQVLPAAGRAPLAPQFDEQAHDLAAGRVVVCDRFADSTRLYQGITRGDLRATVDALHNLMIGREPDLTFVIDMDPETGLSRARGRQGTEERFEDFGIDLQRRMRAGFLDLAREFAGRCRVIDGNRTEAEIAAEILAIAEAVRNWGNWQWWPFWVVDYVSAGLLVAGALMTLAASRWPALIPKAM